MKHDLCRVNALRGPHWRWLPVGGVLADVFAAQRTTPHARRDKAKTQEY